MRERALVKKLQKNISALASWAASAGESAIFPVIVGGEELAMDASRTLLSEGFLVPAIRYPTVARGSAQIAHHGDGRSRLEMIERLVTIVSSLGSASRPITHAPVA